MDILLAIIGIILLIKGNVKVTSKSELSKMAGRSLGVLALLPFIVFFLLGLLKLQVSENFSVYLGYVMFGGVVLAAIIIAVLFRKPIGVALSQSVSSPSPSLKPESSPLTAQSTSQTSPPRVYRSALKPALIIAVIVLLFVGGAVWYLYPYSARTPYASNTLPLYGEGKKTAEQKLADEQFVNDIIQAAGSREAAAKYAVEKAWENYYAGDLETSLKRFNQAWLLEPNSPDIYWGLGVVVGAQGKYDDAIRLFNMGLRLNPKHTMLLCNLGFAYSNKDLAYSFERTSNLGKAIQYFESANLTEAKPGEKDYCHSMWAITLYYQDKYSEAWQHVLTAERYGGKNLDPNFVRDISAKMPRPE